MCANVILTPERKHDLDMRINRDRSLFFSMFTRRGRELRSQANARGATAEDRELAQLHEFRARSKVLNRLVRLTIGALANVGLSRSVGVTNIYGIANNYDSVPAKFIGEAFGGAVKPNHAKIYYYAFYLPLEVGLNVLVAFAETNISKQTNGVVADGLAATTHPMLAAGYNIFTNISTNIAESASLTGQQCIARSATKSTGLVARLILDIALLKGAKSIGPETWDKITFQDKIDYASERMNRIHEEIQTISAILPTIDRNGVLSDLASQLNSAQRSNFVDWLVSNQNATYEKVEQYLNNVLSRATRPTLPPGQTPGPTQPGPAPDQGPNQPQPGSGPAPEGKTPGPGPVPTQKPTGPTNIDPGPIEGPPSPDSLSASVSLKEPLTGVAAAILNQPNSSDFSSSELSTAETALRHLTAIGLSETYYEAIPKMPMSHQIAFFEWVDSIYPGLKEVEAALSTYVQNATASPELERTRFLSPRDLEVAVSSLSAQFGDDALKVLTQFPNATSTEELSQLASVEVGRTREILDSTINLGILEVRGAEPGAPSTLCLAAAPDEIQTAIRSIQALSQPPAEAGAAPVTGGKVEKPDAPQTSAEQQTTPATQVPSTQTPAAQTPTEQPAPTATPTPAEQTRPPTTAPDVKKQPPPQSDVPESASNGQGEEPLPPMQSEK